MRRPAIAMLSGLLLCGVASADRAQHSQSGDRVAMQAQLDSRAKALRRQQLGVPKPSAAERIEIRSQLAEIDAAIARLESGRAVASERTAQLLGSPVAPTTDPDQPQAIADRVSTRHSALESALRPGPKIGALRRAEIRNGLAELDSVIHDLESGKDVSVERVDRVFGIERVDTPQERLRSLEIERATLTRDLRGGGPKLGAHERAAIREEIERLEGTISQL